MKKSFLGKLLVMVFILASSTSLGWWANRRFNGELKAPEVLDLGMVQPGSVAIGNVGIENAGRRDLKISGITTDCGCTVVGVDEMDIEPGSRANIPFKISVPKGDDRHSFRILYRTTDPRKPLAKCDIKIKAEYGVQIVPERLVFMESPNVENGNRSSVGVRVSEGRPDLIDLKVGVEADYLSVTSALVNNREGLIQVVVDEPLINGEFFAKMQVEFQLRGEEKIEQEIVICGRLNGRIEASPAIMQLSLGSDLAAECQITPLPVGKPDFSFIGLSQHAIVAELLPNGKLRLTKGSDPAKKAVGSIVIRWSDARDRLSIPVSIW